MVNRYPKHKLHALCPYFAMFPHTFAQDRILAHTGPGEVVLDPFSGRGTTLLESLLLGRQAIALDINPVAACVTGAKARPPTLDKVRSRITYLAEEYAAADSLSLERERASLPPFFKRGFHPTTLRQILFLRRALDWQNSDVDRFAAALVLGSLHGEMDRSQSYFSNQMPRTISTKPAYSLRYWREHNLWPRKKDTFSILHSRAQLRLSEGVPSTSGLVVFGDSRRSRQHLPNYDRQVGAVVTSPPYFHVTNYEEDQWLRLWFLGGEPKPTYGRVSRDDRHTSRSGYWRFLTEVWRGIAPLLRDQATIVCRIGGTRLRTDEVIRGVTETIRSVFPHAFLLATPDSSSPKRRQTENFRPGTRGCGVEVDLALSIGRT